MLRARNAHEGARKKARKPAKANQASKKASKKAKAAKARKKKRKSPVDPVAVAYEKAVVRQTNSYRASVGCAPVTVNKHLVLAAERHTSLMVRNQDLSHQLAGEARLSKRIVKAGYGQWRVVAENLAVGYSSAPDTMQAWIASPGHKANLDDCNLRHIGVDVQFSDGVAWVTQDFGTDR